MDKFDLKTNLQPDLNGSRCKIGREWKAEIAAIIILINNLPKIKILVQFFNL